MSTDAQESRQASNPLGEGVAWVAKHWPRIRLGHEGFMLDKIQRGARIAEVSARNAMTGDMSNTDGWPGHTGGDAMGVSIGDTIHYHAPHQPADQPSQSPSRTPGALAKWLGPLVLVAAGATGGAGVPWLLGAYEQQQPATMEHTDTDTTRRIDIEKFVPGQE